MREIPAAAITAAVAERARSLMAKGRSVRMERAVPQRMRYRELVHFSEGGRA